VGSLQQLLVELAARQQYSPESQVWSCHAVTVDRSFDLLEAVELLALLLALDMSFLSNIHPEHCCGHATSFPVESVQPLEKIMPIEAPWVPMHSPLLRQMSPLAQQPLCFALGLHGVYDLSSTDPSTP
jgi:hypothetical protein